MDITINIEDYVTPSEIKSIVIEELGHIVRGRFNRSEADLNRLITDVGYEFIFKAVSESIGEDAKQKIADTVTRLLEDESHIRYEVWRRKDAWQKTESPAIDLLDKAVKDNEDLIRLKVIQAIDSFEFPEVKTAIYEALDSIIYDKLFGGAK